MTRSGTVDGSNSRYEYRVCVPAARPVIDYTPRLVPYHTAAAVPLEARGILWQR
jgi:starch phosphorylase